MGATDRVFSRLMQSPPKPMPKEATGFRGRDYQVLIFHQSPFETGLIDIPFLDIPGTDKGLHRLKLSNVPSMNHRGNRDLDTGLPEMIYSLEDFLEGSFSSNQFVSCFHPVEADLDLMDPELLGHVF